MDYRVTDLAQIPSPALLLFLEGIDANLTEMVRIAGRGERLRPHVKTHKLRPLVQRELARGIIRQKCATLAEAEVLACGGVKDIFLAYPVVGPNIARVIRFGEVFPDVKLLIAGDDRRPLASLAAAAVAASQQIEVVLDLDVGQHRTGVPIGEQAAELYRWIGTTPGLALGGLHAYDGHNHQTDFAARQQAVHSFIREVTTFADRLESSGLKVPRIISGGTGSFPILAANDDPRLELSPGTTVLHDIGYRSTFPDLNFIPAAAVLTRVISCPGPNRLTCDVGYKALASDPPLARRLQIHEVPDAQIVMHNEEHLVFETSGAAEFQPGDPLLAFPWHICPTVALHQQAYVIEGGKLVDVWPIEGRDRMLSI